MKNNTVIGLFLSVGSTGLCAESKVDLSLYYVPVIYSDNSIRDDASGSGIYLAWGPDKPYRLEMAFERTRLDFRTMDDLVQYDLTLAGTHFWDNKHALRLGSHIILSSDDKETENGFTLFADYTYFQAYDYNFGSTINYSLYSAQNNFDVVQFSPHIGKYFSSPYLPGVFNVQMTGHLINVDRDSSNNYLSMAGKLNWHYNQFELGVGGWGGTQRYAVANNGFTVYNLMDKHIAGFNVEVAYNFTQDTKLEFRFAQEQMVELTNEEVDVKNYSIFLTHIF